MEPNFKLRKTRTAHYSNKATYQEHPPWVRAQIKAFTGWLNNFLPEQFPRVDETRFGYDLSSGVVLIEVLQALEGKPLARYHKKPALIYHKIENLEYVIRYLTKLGETLVGHEPHALTDDTTNLKMMLGLVWKMIRRYSLDESPEARKKQAPGSPHGARRGSGVVVDSLLEWTREAVTKSCKQAGVPPESVEVTNFTTSFRDGRVLCHLFNSILPDVINVRALGDPRSNLTMCLDYAEKYLSIPKLLDADLMLSEDQVDSLSVMAYVSFFRDCALRPIPPTMPKADRTVLMDKDEGDADSWRRDQVVQGEIHPASIQPEPESLHPDIRREIRKDELLAWVNRKLQPYGITVHNFVQDFQSASPLCALVNSFDSSFDLEKLTEENQVEMMDSAMQLAEKELGIHQTIDGEKMLTEPDEDENIEYLNKFKEYDEKKELLEWANSKLAVSGLHADDLSASWKNPQLLGAMVKYFLPAEVHLDKLDPANPEPAFETVMNIHEDRLQIPRAAEAGEMAREAPEDKVVEYLNAFREHERLQGLLEWVNTKLRPTGLVAYDWDRSWQDPAVVCSVINALAPGAVDISNLPQNGVSTVDDALAYAEKNFAVRPDMDGERLLTNPNKKEVSNYAQKLRDYEQKRALLEWANRRMAAYGQKATDLSQCWADPRLLGALTKSFLPPNDDRIDLNAMGSAQQQQQQQHGGNNNAIVNGNALHNADGMHANNADGAHHGHANGDVKMMEGDEMGGVGGDVGGDGDPAATATEQHFEDVMLIHEQELRVLRAMDARTMRSNPYEDGVVDYLIRFKEYEEYQDLKNWVNKKINPLGCSIDNFDISWQDPKVICALVNALEPNTIDLSQVNDERAIPSADEAMNAAKDKFEILPSMTAEELIMRPNPKSVFNYVKRFRDYERKRGLLAWANGRMAPYGQHANNLHSDWNNPRRLGAVVKSFVPPAIDLPALGSTAEPSKFATVMEAHEREMGIPRAVGPTGMMAPTEGAMIDYLSRFKEHEERMKLLDWVNGRIRPQGYVITDFESSWKDPHILAALVNSFDDHAIDMKQVNDANAVPVTEAAIQYAHTHLTIPPTVSAQDVVVSPNSDKIVQYVAQYRDYERRKAILDWANKKLGNYGLHADNLSTAWKDPLMLGGVVKNFAPTKIDLASMKDPEQRNEYFRHVLHVEEQDLGLPPLVIPEVFENPSEGTIIDCLEQLRDLEEKQQLMAWVNSKISPFGCHINDFQASWQEPKVMCALVKAFDGQVIDLRKVSKLTGVESVDHVMKHAQNNFAIHKTMSGEGLLNAPVERDVIDYAKKFRDYETRKMLLEWANSRMAPYGEHADNLSSNWSNPRLLAALVKSFRPEDVNLAAMKNANEKPQYFEQAMNVHEQHMDIKRVLTADKMVNGPPESGMTEYIARFKEYADRQALLQWVNEKLKPFGQHVDNFDESWKNPGALCGLVNAFQDGAFNMQDMNKGVPEEHIDGAMKIADSHLNIPSSISANEMAEGATEADIMPYINRFRELERQRELLAWANKRLAQHGQHADNFTSSWTNPMVLGALVKSFTPDSIDLTKLNDDPKNNANHFEGIMEVHEQKLYIPRTLTAGAMAAPPETAMVNYISQFRDKEEEAILLAWVNDRLKPFKLHVTNFDSSWQNPLIMCALLNSFKPNAVDLAHVQQSTAVANVNEAIAKSHSLLNIPPTVSGDGMVNHPYAPAIRDYVAQFRALDKGTQPLRSQLNVPVDRVIPGCILQPDAGNGHDTAGNVHLTRVHNVLYDQQGVSDAESLGALGHARHHGQLHPAAMEASVVVGTTAEVAPIVALHQTEEAVPLTAGVDVMKALRDGHLFTNYHDANNPVKQEIFMFYEPDEGDASLRKGKICWCEPGKREIVPGQTMEIHQITDLYAGKLTPVLNTELAQSAPDECCFSVLGYSNVRDLEADSEETANTWIEGLTFLMGASKAEVRDLVDQAEPEPEDLLDPNDPNVRRLFKGRNFTGYEYDGNKQPFKRDLFVFLSRTGGKLGSLHFCDAGRRIETPDTCLVTHKITDVYGGKQTAIFKTDLAKGIHGSRCITLVSGEREVNLECQTKEQLMAWVTALNHVMSKGGKRVEKGQRQLEGDMTDSAAFKATDRGTADELDAVLKKGETKQEIIDICLFRAAVDFDMKKLIILLDNKAQVNAKDAGQTPLHRALMWADLGNPKDVDPVVRLLVSAGADRSALDEEGKRPSEYLHDSTLRELSSALRETRTYEEVKKLYSK